MEIRVYDSAFNLKKVVENFVSLLWHRCYNSVGDFKITAPATAENIYHLAIDNIVWVEGKTEAGVIESREIQQDNTKNEIVVSGRFLESYMDRRLIRPRINYSGQIEVGMRKILTDAVPIPMVQLGEFNDFPETIRFQATYKNLLKYEEKLAKSGEFGFRFRPDFKNKVIYFEVYKGLDRSISQSSRARVIFSEEYATLTSSTYSESSQLYNNVCYVGGQGEGDARTYVVVGDDSLTGLERREVFLNATDVSQDEMTEQEYLDALRQRGQDLLNENIKTQAVTCVTNPNGNFVYKKHYDVGDIVTVQKKSWGVNQNERITEVTEIYEHEVPVIEPVFGTLIPETIDWED